MERGWRRGALAGLIVWALAVAGVLLSPWTPGDAVLAVTNVLASWIGVTGIRFGWVEFVANVMLFLPLGFFFTCLWRRPITGALVALAVSVAAETAQFAVPGRLPSVRDVVANVAGALVGAAIGTLVLRRCRTHPRRPGARPRGARRPGATRPPPPGE